jgi:MoaA/NifB/PqqE/SkfB family radical SAM enzyme
MECINQSPKLKVELKNKIYNIEFGQIQIEITGKCNMNCEHCRASNQKRKDMPLEQIIKIVKFARQFSPNYKEIILSGGEPLLHNNFKKVLTEVKKNGGDFITLTTNGSVLTKEHLELIKKLKFERFILSVSLDNLDKEKHDRFRNYKGAFEKATNSLKLIKDFDSLNIISSMRSTIQASQIPEMEEMVKFAEKWDVRELVFQQYILLEKLSKEKIYG